MDIERIVPMVVLALALPIAACETQPAERDIEPAREVQPGFEQRPELEQPGMEQPGMQQPGVEPDGGILEEPDTMGQTDGIIEGEPGTY